MSNDRPLRKDIEALCQGVGPEDGIDPRYLRHGTRDRVIGRKTLQLCGEVRNTLSAVLADCADAVLRELEVVNVRAASGSGRLLVTVQPMAPATAEDLACVMQRLGAAQGMLRLEVARAVHRRKAPELIWQVQPHAWPPTCGRIC